MNIPRIGTVVSTTDYIAGKHYENGALTFFQHAEGRYVKSGTTWEREYYLTDHLGNVRVTVREIPLTGNEIPEALVEGFVTLVSQTPTSATLGQNIQEPNNEVGTNSTYFWSLYPAEEQEETFDLLGGPGGAEVIASNDKILSTEITLTAEGFGTWYLIRRYESILLDDNTGLPLVTFAEVGKAMINAPIPEAEVVQRQGYYPYGSSFNSWTSTSPENRYKYNGVEFEGATGMYETLFRGYDPYLGRFAQIDLLADFIPGISPYHFGFNNPISYGDPTGLFPIPGFIKRLFNGFVGNGASRQARRSQRKNNAVGVARSRGRGKNTNEGSPTFLPPSPVGRIPIPEAKIPQFEPKKSKVEVVQIREYRVGPGKFFNPVPSRRKPERKFPVKDGDSLPFDIGFEENESKFENEDEADAGIEKIYTNMKLTPHILIIINPRTNVSFRGHTFGNGRSKSQVLVERAEAVRTALIKLGIKRDRIKIGRSRFKEHGTKTNGFDVIYRNIKK